MLFMGYMTHMLQSEVFEAFLELIFDGGQKGRDDYEAGSSYYTFELKLKYTKKKKKNLWR